jgi:YVTN family beta-propeller protein
MRFQVGSRSAKRILHVGICLGLIFGATRFLVRAQLALQSQAPPGRQADGTMVLANGWRLSPAGKHLPVGDLPLNLIQSPDGRYLLVINNGLARPSLTVVDAASWAVKSTTPLDGAFLGLVWHPTAPMFYLAGAALNNVQEFGFADGVPTRLRSFALPGVAGQSFAGGLAISPDGGMLYVTRLFAMTLSSIDLATGKVVKTVSLPAEPYTVLVSKDGSLLYVSVWGGSMVQLYNARTLTLINDWPTDERPNAMALSPDGARLFVACGGGSSVWVYSTVSGDALEMISTSLYPLAPPTATPDALSVSPDGRTLVVANADNNAVAVVDVSSLARSFVTGFIPTGWYPTSVLFAGDGQRIFILSGKGLATGPATDRGTGAEVQRLSGVLSAVPTPDRTTLADYTRKVYAATPYTDANLLRPANAPVASPIPLAVGGSSPLKHVFYVIRENRTYDQILGDLKQGNGDPALTLFGNSVTPNAHALAQNFTLFDNFYVDAEVSYDGHAFSTAAYANDFIQKIWQAYYGNRGATYLSEGGGFFRNPYGNIAAPTGGYIWDYARRAHVTVRSYGEFVDNVKTSALGDPTARESVPGLADAVAPRFAGFDLSITDQKRTDAWAAEFAAYVGNGQLPQLSIIHLGNDHTAGTTAGMPTPRAMIADNDYALGRVVETISNSVYWKDSAIFVVEDDSQSGPDHVDSHRSVLLVASPFAKRATVDHTFNTTSGVLRTMELILGLPPMSQFDAAATPMYNAFQATPNLAAFGKVAPGVSLDEKNVPTSAGASASLQMDFSDADLTAEQPLNEILWRSVKGDRPMPPPRRSIFAGRRN